MALQPDPIADDRWFDQQTIDWHDGYQAGATYRPSLDLGLVVLLAAIALTFAVGVLVGHLVWP